MSNALADITAEEWDRVVENIGLIGGTLRTYNMPDFDADDAAGDGVFGLARAVQLHDPEKGALSTLAYYHVRQSVARGRGVREGRNFRRAQREGTVSTYEAPRSLDADLSREGSTLHDYLHGDHDTEHLVEVNLELEQALDRMRAVVRDALDQALLDEVLETCSIDFNLSAFARRYPHLNRESIRRRRERLVRAGAAA